MRGVVGIGALALALDLTNGPVDAQRPADAALQELLARARQSSVVFFDEFSDVVAGERYVPVSRSS